MLPVVLAMRGGPRILKGEVALGGITGFVCDGFQLSPQCGSLRVL
jgi:hypothetical protein